MVINDFPKKIVMVAMGLLVFEVTKFAIYYI